MARMIRQGKGRQDPFERGGEDEFVIPPDMMPAGLASAMDVEVVIRGVLNVDTETGQGIVYVNRLYVKKPHSRTDTMEDEIEVTAKRKMAE